MVSGSIFRASLIYVLLWGFCLRWESCGHGPSWQDTSFKFIGKYRVGVVDFVDDPSTGFTPSSRLKDRSVGILWGALLYCVEWFGRVCKLGLRLLLFPKYPLGRCSSDGRC